MVGLIVGILATLAAVVLIIVCLNIRIVKQSQAWVMERIGVYCGTWHTGLHIKFPFIERRRGEPIDLREQVMYSDPSRIEGGIMNVDEAEDNKLRDDWYSLQTVITKDNVRVWVDTVIFYQITDCKLYVYGHANPLNAIRQLVATTLRNLIGELELDAVLTSRDTINSRLRAALDEATDAWGIKVNRVELKNIVPPKSIVSAMETQMKAERERRATVLEAEGKRKSAILEAEGEKQAQILKAEGEKQAVILAAEAAREKMICEAEGEAEAILQVQQATAEGIKMVKAADPSKEVLAIRSLEAFEKAADGQATKIIIPSEIQGLAGLASSAAEIFKAE